MMKRDLSNVRVLKKCTCGCRMWRLKSTNFFYVPIKDRWYYDGSEYTFEQMLGKVHEEVQTELLFHLDVFV